MVKFEFDAYRVTTHQHSLYESKPTSTAKETKMRPRFVMSVGPLERDESWVRVTIPLYDTGRG